MQYTIASQTYSGQKAVRQHAAALRTRLGIGTRLGGDDERFALGLLALHPEAKRLGRGLDHIFVQDSDFGIAYKSGKTASFSVFDCVKVASVESTPRFRTACQEEVKPYIDGRLEEAFASGPVHCVVTGFPLAIGQGRIGEKPPKTFRALVDAFVVTEGLDLAKVAIVGRFGTKNRPHFADRGLAQRWCRFYMAHAELQIMTLGAYDRLKKEDETPRVVPLSREEVEDLLSSWKG